MGIGTPAGNSADILSLANFGTQSKTASWTVSGNRSRMTVRVTSSGEIHGAVHRVSLDRFMQWLGRFDLGASRRMGKG
jgi:hypothetical protein